MSTTGTTGPDSTEGIDRSDVLGRLSRMLGMPDIAAIRQRGRDPQTAKFTIDLADGRSVRVGTINTLWSQAELGKVLSVAIGKVPARQKPGDWQDVLAGVFATVLEVEEVEGEAFEDAVAEWLGEYLESHAVSSDRSGACARSRPFREDGRVYVHAQDLRKYVIREFNEQVPLADLRQALVDLGYERETVWYQRANKRASKSYYVADDDAPAPEPPASP